MSSGQPFSSREKAYIDEWAYRKSWKHIAIDLGNLFPGDNGGTRTWKGVKSYVVRKQKASERSEYIPVMIHRDVVTLATKKGFHKTDLSILLLDRLRDVTTG